MGVTNIEKEGKKVKLTVEIELSETSMLKSELAIEKALNAAGVAAGELALSKFDTDGNAIEVDGKKLTTKGKQKKNIKDNMEL